MIALELSMVTLVRLNNVQRRASHQEHHMQYELKNSRPVTLAGQREDRRTLIYRERLGQGVEK